MKTKQLSTHILSCSEIEVNYKRPLFTEMKHIKRSDDAYRIIMQSINNKRIDLKEFFWVILLTHSNRIIGISEIASGTPKGVAINIMEIFQLILKTNALAFIVIHNHPSGNLKPSTTDKEITQKINKISNLLDVTLLDHLIITSEDYYSFCDNNIL